MTPRRALWLFRLIFYPTAVLAVVLLLMRADPATHGGTLTFTERFRQPSGYSFTCASGAVAFIWPR